MEDITVSIVEEPVEVTVNPPENVLVSVEENPINVSIENNPINLAISETPFTITFADPDKVGAKGEKGDSGNIVLGVAGQALGSSRLVVKSAIDGKLYYADDRNIDHAYGVFGITRTSALPNEAIEVYTLGEVEEVAWNWTPNEPIFMAQDGYMTQGFAATDYFVTIGFAITPKKILIRIDNPIFLIN